MADYKDIVGTTVRNNAGDLSSAKTGELFYDSTNRNFSYKFPNVTSAGSWRTSNNINTTRMYHDGAGTRDATIIFGGSPQAPATPQVANAEVYDGTSWTEVGDLNDGRENLAGAGTSTLSVVFGGSPGYKNTTEEFSSGPTTVTFTDS